jgi:hypothetical protein
MLLASPGPLLTPPPSSFPLKTPIRSYSAQTPPRNGNPTLPSPGGRGGRRRGRGTGGQNGPQADAIALIFALLVLVCPSHRSHPQKITRSGGTGGAACAPSDAAAARAFWRCAAAAYLGPCLPRTLSSSKSGIARLTECWLLFLQEQLKDIIIIWSENPCQVGGGMVGESAGVGGEVRVPCRVRGACALPRQRAARRTCPAVSKWVTHLTHACLRRRCAPPGVRAAARASVSRACACACVCV